MSYTIYGGCLCGAIKYELLGLPRSVAYCHCRMCQRASGATTIAWATFDRAALHLTHGAPATFRSSPKATRSFCRDCGTQLFFAYAEGPDELDVTLGSLEDPNALSPTYHTWVKRCPRWLVIQDGLPQFEEDGPDFNPYNKT
jgi:hypothetical protein